MLRHSLKLMNTSSAAGSGAASRSQVADLRSFLLGRWRLQRVITDELHRVTMSAEGHAVFEQRTPGTLHYVETGKLLVGEAPAGDIRQTYDYLIEPDAPHRAQVCFSDGRPFHTLDLSTGEAKSVQHVCVRDLYVGDFVVMSGDRWRMQWRVTGPRKDHSIVSEFTREPAAPAATEVTGDEGR
jgi:hypothetical protein